MNLDALRLRTTLLLFCIPALPAQADSESCLALRQVTQSYLKSARLSAQSISTLEERSSAAEKSCSRNLGHRLERMSAASTAESCKAFSDLLGIYSEVIESSERCIEQEFDISMNAMELSSGILLPLQNSLEDLLETQAKYPRAGTLCPREARDHRQLAQEVRAIGRRMLAAQSTVLDLMSAHRNHAELALAGAESSQSRVASCGAEPGMQALVARLSSFRTRSASSGRAAKNKPSTITGVERSLEKETGLGSARSAPAVAAHSKEIREEFSATQGEGDPRDGPHLARAGRNEPGDSARAQLAGDPEWSHGLRDKVVDSPRGMQRLVSSEPRQSHHDPRSSSLGPTRSAGSVIFTEGKNGLELDSSDEVSAAYAGSDSSGTLAHSAPSPGAVPEPGDMEQATLFARIHNKLKAKALALDWKVVAENH